MLFVLLWNLLHSAISKILTSISCQSIYFEATNQVDGVGERKSNPFNFSIVHIFVVKVYFVIH